MAPLTPRKDEWEAIYALIGPTVEELAELPPEEAAEVKAAAVATSKAVLKSAWESLRRREWFCIIHEYGGAKLYFGPEGSQSAAEKWVYAHLNGGIASIFRVHPSGAHADWLAEQEEEWALRRDNGCAHCGHPVSAHDFRNARGEKVPRPKSAKYPCSSTCMCAGFQQRRLRDAA